MVNNKLAPEYASQPVVIIGYNVDTANTVAPNRRNRFDAAMPSWGSLPLLMVDSGQQAFWGTKVPDLDAKYHSMIDAELNRPPQADIQATYTRVGNHFSFSVQVTNQSGVTLSKTANRAMVHAVVYEVFTNDTRPADILTNTFARATASTYIIDALAAGAKGSYSLTTPDLTNVKNWDNLRMLVMVDDRPGVSTGAYDMLQAAFAQPASAFTITPVHLDFLVNSTAPANQSAPIRVNSASTSLTWSASVSAGAPWLSVSPNTGSASMPVQVTVAATSLASGTQRGTVTIQVTDVGGLNQQVQIPVSASLSVVRKLYLPIQRR